MKKILSLLVLALALGTASAEIIPPHGEGQIGLQAVVLCDSLAVRQEPDANAAVRKTLRYGDRFIVVSRQDGCKLLTVMSPRFTYLPFHPVTAYSMV